MHFYEAFKFIYVFVDNEYDNYTTFDASFVDFFDFQ